MKKATQKQRNYLKMLAITVLMVIALSLSGCSSAPCRVIGCNLDSASRSNFCAGHTCLASGCNNEAGAAFHGNNNSLPVLCSACR